MQSAKIPDRQCRQGGAAPARLTWRFHRVRTIVCFAAMAVFAAAANPGQQGPPADPDKPYLLPEANRLPDVNDQMRMREQQGKQQNYAAANVERRKQIADDSAKLLKLATDLKSEVDKTTKDTLSLGVIRKADEIERLAHSVKEKMKLTVGGS